MILSLYIYCLAIILVIQEILDLFFVDAVKIARIFTKIEGIFAVKNNMKLLLILLGDNHEQHYWYQRKLWF